MASQEEINKDLSEELKEAKADIAYLKSKLGKTEKSKLDFNFSELNDAISNPIAFLNSKLENFGSSIVKTIGDINEAATAAASKFGTGLKNYESISQEIAKVLPDLTKLGFEASEIGKMQSDFTEKIGTNVVLSADALKNIGTLDKLGINGAEMAAAFRNSAQSVSGMVEELNVAGQVAGDYGVNVSKIFEDIQKAMQTADQYRFENGVEGISKMAAQTAIMGIKFESVVGFADKVMNPQGAIETVAALQRLGVAASGLQDPFKLMYMAQSDMEGLTEEIGKSVSNLGTFNRETGKVEIPPSARMAMKEIATTLNLSEIEMNKLVSQQAKFNALADDFEGLNVPEEDRMMLANFAEINKNTGELEIKVPGQMETKAITELSKEDMDILRQRPENLEEAAFEQLSVTQTISGQIKSMAQGGASAVTATKTQFDAEKLARTSVRGVGDATTEAFKAANIRKQIDIFAEDLGIGFGKLLEVFSGTGTASLKEALDLLEQAGEKGATSFDDTMTRFGTTLMDSLSKIPDKIDEVVKDNNIYKPFVDGLKEVLKSTSEGISKDVNDLLKTLGIELQQNSETINARPSASSASSTSSASSALSAPSASSEIPINNFQPTIPDLSAQALGLSEGLNQQEYKSFTPTENEVPPAQRLMDSELSLSQQDYASLATLEIPKNEVPPAQRLMNRELSLSQQYNASSVTPPAVTDVTNILNNQTNNTQALTSIQPIAPREIATQQAQANATPVANEEKEIRVKFDPFIVKLEGDGKSIEMALQDNVVRDKIIDMVGKAMTSDYNTMGRPILGNRA
jgi:hypothetical protein